MTEKCDNPALTTSLGGFDDAAHQKICSLKHCPRCKFIGNRERWLKLCPWLDSKLWGVGCKVCSQMLEQKPDIMQRFSHHRHVFAQFAVRDNNLSMDRFKKHQESPAHRTAAQMGADPSAGLGLEDSDGNVPTTSDWIAVLKHTEPSRLTLSVADAGEKKKCAMMRYCLAEGHRAKQLNHCASHFNRTQEEIVSCIASRQPMKSWRSWREWSTCRSKWGQLMRQAQSASDRRLWKLWKLSALPVPLQPTVDCCQKQSAQDSRKAFSGALCPKLRQWQPMQRLTNNWPYGNWLPSAARARWNWRRLWFSLSLPSRPGLFFCCFAAIWRDRS